MSRIRTGETVEPEQREPLLLGDRDSEFVSYYDEHDIRERVNHKDRRSRTHFGVFVAFAILAIIALAVGLFFLTNNVPTSPSPQPSVVFKYRHAALATDHPICSRIGRQILENGGSSVDATIAVQVCYSVIQPQSSGLAGGFFMVVYNRTSRTSTSIDAREVAPLAATEDMYVNHSGESEVGGKSIAVPSEVSGYKKAHDLFGRLPWYDLFEPSISLCKNGFPVSQHLEDYWKSEKEKIFGDVDMRKTYTDPATGDFYKTGQILKLPALGATIQRIATEGAETFYTGNLSKDILLDLKEKGSIITAEDLRNYKTIANRSLQATMDDGSVLYSAIGPSGGPVLIFIMNILDGYKIASGRKWDKEEKLLAYHRVVEAFKFGYAKRTDMGDPEFVSHVSALVANLTSRDYADSIRKMIWDNATHDWPYYGPTYYDQYKTSTAHASIVGNDSLAVSVTTTVNLRFGSGVMGRRTGLLFNDEMDDFSTPNLTNYFGVKPSPSNFIKPGKRPLSSMCPAVLVTKDNKIKMVLGAAGGTRITTATAFVMTNILWFGDTVTEAVDAHRIHHQLLPPYISYEEGFPQYYLEGLQALGHNVSMSNTLSIVEAITGDGTWYYATGDYRRPGSQPDGF